MYEFNHSYSVKLTDYYLFVSVSSFHFFKMVLIYKNLIFMLSLYAVTTKITADSIILDTQCETMCSFGSSILWQMFDVCYPGIFNPDELSLKEKVIYSICSNDAINVSTKVWAIVFLYL